MPELFVPHLSGPPCSGKTTLEDALAERLPGAYIVSFDRMKWQLTGYDRHKDGPLVDELTMAFFGAVCEKKISILLDFSFPAEEEYLACRRVAEQHGYRFISIELTAPVPVLLERFRKRIAEAAASGARITITGETDFLETAAKKFYLPGGTPRFDTSLTAIGDIASQTLHLIHGTTG